jgi:hypothetical protein
MPSSLIIVALAAAWLVVLVPMIARKRQEVARTADSALAARVVRSGSTHSRGREEFAMAGTAKPEARADDVDLDEDLDAELEEFDDVEELEPAQAEPELPPLPQPSRDSGTHRRYRPGRGGFDPEAAEVAARAKYAFRQRVVVALIIAALATGLLAGFLLPVLWWAHAAFDAVLVGYLGYLRRQVRIENEIRQRRLARLGGVRRSSAGRAAFADEPDEDFDVVPAQREVVGCERKPSPTSRVRRSAVVVDLDDEDPAFHELDEPGHLPFRRASGE